MTTLQECSVTLARLFLERNNHQTNVDRIQSDLDTLELKLTPPDGWPGKNDGQRDTARGQTLLNNADYQEMTLAMSETRDAMAEVEATIAGVQETASAERWRIREAMAAALLARYHGERVEDAAPSAPEFDQALQGAVDEALDDAASDTPPMDGFPVPGLKFRDETPIRPELLAAILPDDGEGITF